MAMKDFNSDYSESCIKNEESTSWGITIDKEIEDPTKDLNTSEVFDPTKDLLDYQEKPKEVMESTDDNVIKKRTRKHRKYKENKKHASNKTQIKLLNKRVKKLEHCLDDFIEQLPKLQDLQTNYPEENAHKLCDKVGEDLEDLLKSFELKYGPDNLLKVNVSKTDDYRDKKRAEKQMKKTEIAKDYFYPNQQDYLLNEQKEIDMHHASLHMHQLNLNVTKRSHTSMALNNIRNYRNVVLPMGNNFVSRPRKPLSKGRVAVFVKLSEVELPENL